MLDQRLDPKRERWINLGFVLLTVAVAVALVIIAGKFALDQNDGGVDSNASSKPQQARNR
jgi:hypothetical protein